MYKTVQTYVDKITKLSKYHKVFNKTFEHKNWKTNVNGNYFMNFVEESQGF